MEYMESRMNDQIEGANESYNRLCDDLSRQTELLAWAYSKLHMQTFSSMSDALKLDEIKMILEGRTE